MLSKVICRLRDFEVNEKYINNYAIFAIVFFFHLIFIFQGLDVSDAGFHLTNQVSAFSFLVEFNSISPMIFLTDFIGGFWLSLFGEPSLLWARLGGVLIIALNAAIIFSILSVHFEQKRVFFVVLISTLFLTMSSGLYLIHYFSFPALLINIEFWILNKSLMQRCESNFYNFMLGFMLIPIILSRIPLILILLIPILIFIYGLIKRTDLRKYRAIAITSSLGFCFAAIFFGAIYLITGVLDGYFNYIYSTISASAIGNTQVVDQTHTLSSLIKSYLIDYRNVMVGTALLFILFYTLSLAKNKLGPIFTWTATLSLTLIVISIMLYKTSLIVFFAYNLLKVVIGPIILISLAYVFADSRNNENKILNVLLFSGIIIMIINPLGSNVGILKSFYGMWLILPLAILCGFQLKTSAENKTIRSIFSLMNCVLLSLLILTLFFHSTNVYCDDINRFELNTEFSSSGLMGIYSTPDRVDVVDSLINEIKSLSEKGDSISMGVSIPMFYYLTETRPALGNPWIGIMSKNDINSSLRDMEETGNYPKLFIEQKIVTTGHVWPKGNTPMKDEYKEIQGYLKSKFLNKYNYRIVWENYAFAIYQRPK